MVLVKDKTVLSAGDEFVDYQDYIDSNNLYPYRTKIAIKGIKLHVKASRKIVKGIIVLTNGSLYTFPQFIDNYGTYRHLPKSSTEVKVKRPPLLIIDSYNGL